MADDHHVAASGHQFEGVVAAVADRPDDLRFHRKRVAGEFGRVASPHPGAREAGVDVQAEGRDGPSGGGRLGFAPGGQAAGGVALAGVVFGVAVSQ